MYMWRVLLTTGYGEDQKVLRDFGTWNAIDTANRVFEIALGDVIEDGLTLSLPNEERKKYPYGGEVVLLWDRDQRLICWLEVEPVRV